MPETVFVGGLEYSIGYDFRTCLNVLLAFEDNSLTPMEKQWVLLDCMYPETTPKTLVEAVNAAMAFLNGEEKQEDDVIGDRLYSFSHDAKYIFAAFRQTHQINLQVENLHWWEFMALFMDLGQDTTFSNLVSLRKRLKDGTASKEERRAAVEMDSIVTLPEIDTRTLDEKEKANKFMLLMAGGSK